jgi:hypothetical protein
MDLDLEKAAEINECYRDEDGNLLLTVTVSDENKATPGPSTADPRQSIPLKQLPLMILLLKTTLPPGEENDRPQKKWKQNKRKENK